MKLKKLKLEQLQLSLLLFNSNRQKLSNMAQAPVTADFNGTWKLNRSENLDEYLKAEV